MVNSASLEHEVKEAPAKKKRRKSKNRLITDAVREVKATFSRFLSILVLSALAVAFLAGLRTTAPDMEYTADNYYDRSHLMDAYVLSTLGLTEGDLEALAHAPGVSAAEGGWILDATVKDAIAVVRSAPENLDLLELTDGRLPEAADECVTEKLMLVSLGAQIGDAIELMPGEGHEEDLTRTTYTIVGVAESPLYVGTDRGSSSLGSGSADGFIYIPAENFNLDYYTVASLTFDGLAALDCYGDEYDERLDAYLDALEDLADTRARLRSEEVIGEAQEELDRARQELEDAKAQAEEELQDAWQKLQDARQKLDDGWVEYQDGVDAYNTGIADAEQRLRNAMSTLRDSQAELDDGRVQYNDGLQEYQAGLREYEENRLKLEEAAADLAEGWQSLEDARTEAQAQLADAWQKLQDARQELDDGWAEYQEGQDAYQREIAEAERKLQSAADAIQSGEQQLTAGREQYAQGLAQYESALSEYEANRAALDAAQAQIDAAQTELDGQQARLDAGYAAYEEGLKPYEGTPFYDQAVAAAAEQKAQLDAAQAQLDGGYAQLQISRQEMNEGLAQLNAGKATLDAAKAALDQSGIQLAEAEGELAHGRQEYQEGQRALEQARADGQKELDDALKKLNDGEAEYTDGLSEYNEARSQAEAELSDAQAELQSAQQEYDDGVRQLAEAKQTLDEAKATLDDTAARLSDAENAIADGWREYRQGLADLEQARMDGRRELDDALQELNDGEDEYADGLEEYNDGRAEADQEIADAEEKLNDAQAEVDDIKNCQWYLLGRDTNMGIEGYAQDAERVGNLADVFPIIFFLVAGLACLTTMTRMVEDQRTQIGALKALGFSRLAIATKYIGYAFWASFLGGVLGLLVGCTLIPAVIANAFNIMYHIPALEFKIQPAVCILSVLAAVACSTGAALWATLSTLMDTPANLMRPKSPKAGKRVLLERVTPLWRRLSFTWKVTMRNLFRYKRRFWMTVVGIGGCTALIVTGFGLHDSIFDILDKQFDEISLYDATVGLDDSASPRELQQVRDYLDDSPSIERWLMSCQETANASTDGPARSVTVFVVDDPEPFGEFIDLRHRKDDAPVTLTDDGVILTEKLAELLGVLVGDTVTLDKDGRVDAVVTDIVENYVYHYVYLTDSCYERLFGEKAENNIVMLSYAGGGDQAESDRVSEELMAMDAVASYSYIATIRDTFTNSMNAINYAVIIIIAAAAALAFVVLYNLTNINITERIRELATLKVLGFYDLETTLYVVRENLFLTLFGILLGLGLGRVLHAWLVLTVEVDLVMFGRTAPPYAYVLAAVLTIAFSVVVNIAAHFKLKKVGMVESLKTVE